MSPDYARRSTFGPTAGDLSEALADHVEALVAELLPGGQREGADFRAGGLAGDRGRSLSVRLAGPRAGLWQDRATGASGDALDLVAEVLGLPKGEACRWAREWLGLERGAFPLESRILRVERPAPEPAPEDTERKAKALRRWAQGVPLAGTHAEAYLIARGLTRPPLGWPESLRFLPAATFHPKAPGVRMPALVALVERDDGPSGIQCVFLDPTGEPRKAPGLEAKISSGLVGGGAVRLWPAGEVLAVSEGLEDALSVAQASGWRLPAWACLGTSSLKAVRVPGAVREVIIAADADQAGEDAARALSQRLTLEGRRIRIARPPSPFKDFNEALQAGQEAV